MLLRMLVWNLEHEGGLGEEGGQLGEQRKPDKATPSSPVGDILPCCIRDGVGSI